MTELMQTGLTDLAYVLLAVALLLVAKLTLAALTPFSVADQLASKDNPAFGVSLVGYYLGVFTVFIGATHGDTTLDEPLWRQLGTDAAWTLFGIVLLNVSRVIVDRIVLRRFSTRKEIIEDRNCGMGAIEFGVYMGSAFVVAGALCGEGGGIITVLAFYALGQLALIAYAWLYQRLVGYDFQGEVEAGNVAAGVAFSGNVVAMGLLLARASAGDFVAWSDNLATFGFYTLVAFVLLPAGRWLIDWVLLPRRTLHEEIAQDRNINAGYLEAGGLIGMAAVIFFIV